MSNKNPKNNSQNLLKYAQTKRQLTYEKVELAINQLIKEKKIINFNTVAEMAGVSKPYLYNHSEFRDRIETLRLQQSKVTSPKAIKQNMTDQNKDAIIEVLRLKIKELESQNKDLLKQLQKYRGKIYDSI